jgi:hypothetical protein
MLVKRFDYGLDLNNFHEGSHGKIIVPVLKVDIMQYWKEYTKKLANLYQTIYANVK